MVNWLRIVIMQWLVTTIQFFDYTMVDHWWYIDTVDGRNPAPVDGWFIPLFIGFQPSKVMQDFFHPQYIKWLMVING